MPTKESKIEEIWVQNNLDTIIKHWMKGFKPKNKKEEILQINYLVDPVKQVVAFQMLVKKEGS